MNFADQVRRLDAACLQVFGRVITYFPETGGEAAVRAVFQPAAAPEDTSPGVYAVVFLRLVDLPTTPVRGDELEIDGVRYKVFDMEADGSGSVVLKARTV